MKTNNEKMIDKLVEIYITDFRGLSDKQQTLLAYRKIIEFKQNRDNLKQEILSLGLDEMDILDVIIKASNHNVGFMSSLILYAMCDSEQKHKTLYRESLISYNKVLENYKLLARELGVDDSLCEVVK